LSSISAHDFGAPERRVFRFGPLVRHSFRPDGHDGQNDEDQEFAQGAEEQASREPHGSPQGPHLHHQQAESAVQGAPRL